MVSGAGGNVPQRPTTVHGGEAAHVNTLLASERFIETSPPMSETGGLWHDPRLEARVTDEVVGTPPRTWVFLAARQGPRRIHAREWSAHGHVRLFQPDMVKFLAQ